MGNPAASDPLWELDAIVRGHGAVGGPVPYGWHLEVHRDVWELMRACGRAPQGGTKVFHEPDPLAVLAGLRVVVSGKLPPGGWRLIQTWRDGPLDYTRHVEVIREGTVRCG